MPNLAGNLCNCHDRGYVMAIECANMKYLLIRALVYVLHIINYLDIPKLRI